MNLFIYLLFSLLKVKVTNDYKTLLLACCLVSFFSFYISSNISVSLGNFIIFSTSQFFPTLDEKLTNFFILKTFCLKRKLSCLQKGIIPKYIRQFNATNNIINWISFTLLGFLRSYVTKNFQSQFNIFYIQNSG